MPGARQGIHVYIVHGMPTRRSLSIARRGEILPHSPCHLNFKVLASLLGSWALLSPIATDRRPGYDVAGATIRGGAGVGGLIMTGFVVE